MQRVNKPVDMLLSELLSCRRCHCASCKSHTCTEGPNCVESLKYWRLYQEDVRKAARMALDELHKERQEALKLRNALHKLMCAAKNANLKSNLFWSIKLSQAVAEAEAILFNYE